ncbi:hypothetical protein EGW08_021270, partial [Elysia chlorotica]
MEEDTSRADSGDKIVTVPVKVNTVPAIETNGLSGGTTPDNDNAKGLSALGANKPDERSGALGGVSNNLTETNQAVASTYINTPFPSNNIGQALGVKLQNLETAKPAHIQSGTYGNNNNNNVEKAKLKSSMSGMSTVNTEGSHTPTTKGATILRGSLESGNMDAACTSVPSFSNTVISAQNVSSQGSFIGVQSVRAADHQLSTDSIPSTGDRPEEERKLSKLLLDTGHSLRATQSQILPVSQRLSPSHFQRSVNSQRLSPAHFSQMSTSDMIHSASTLIHGPEMQGIPSHPETSDHLDQSPTGQPSRATYDSLKKGNSPVSGNVKCQDITSNQLKNYLMSPTQGRGVYPSSDQPPATHVTSNLPQQIATPASKPTQKAPRKRKSKAATKGQSLKSSSFLGDDDDDNDFIPVGMVQLSSLRRPAESNSVQQQPNPVQQRNQLLKEQLQRHLGQQQQNQERLASSTVAQHQVSSQGERKDVDTRSQQHQLLLQLVQQVQQAQQQKLFLEEQRQQQQQQQQQQHYQEQQQLQQQASPQLDHHQSNTLHNTNVKLHKVQKNQGLSGRNFQQEFVPAGPEEQLLSSESQVSKSGHRQTDHRITPSSHHQQIPAPSLPLPSPAQPSYSYASQLPHNTQTPVFTKSAPPQSTAHPIIPKITEQLLQRPPSDQQVYLPENKPLVSNKEDQRASKVELYLLQSRAEGSQSGLSQPLQSPSPTWHTARSTTPTLTSGQHSHQHPEISRMLCSPVSPRQSTSSPRASASPRGTESPFQPPSSPCQFVSPKQPVSPHARMGSSVSANASASAGKTGQGLVRNAPNQPGNLKVSYTRQNSSPRPPNSPWQPISPSQISASNLTNFTGVQKPHPTVGQASPSAHHGQDTSCRVSSSLPSSSHLPQQHVQHQEQNPSLGVTIPSSLHYSQVDHFPSSPGTNSQVDDPIQTPNPGQVIHHLPTAQPSSAHHQHANPPTSSLTSLRVPKPSAQNASPIWQQMQHQHQVPYQESLNTSAPPPMADTSKAMGLFLSKPVDIQRLSQQQHQHQQHLEHMAHQSFQNSHQNLPLEHNQSQVCASSPSSQPQFVPVPPNNPISQNAPNVTSDEPSGGLNNLPQRESKQINSVFPGNEGTRSDQVMETDTQARSLQQHLQIKAVPEQDDQIAAAKDVRKSEGALQVLSEIASKRYVQTVESEKLEQKEKQELEKSDSSSLEVQLTETPIKEDKALKSGRASTKSKIADEQQDRKLEVSSEAPKREVRQRKPKKPFEQEETPSRRNVRNGQNQKGQSDTPINKKPSTPSSPSRSIKKGQLQSKKSGSVSSGKSDTEQESKTPVASKSINKPEAGVKESRQEEEGDSGLEGDSDTESAEPRRLSRRLQVKKEERLRQKSDAKNTEEEDSNQRRSRRIATRIDYQEENSENTSEESGSGRQQKASASTIDAESKSVRPGSPPADGAGTPQVSTRSRNSRRDTSKDPSSSRSTSSSSRKEISNQKLSDADKKIAQTTPASKSITTTPKYEPQISSERKMRTRNRSKSRSRSPLTTAAAETSTPVTRRNLATRQVTSAPKSSQNEAINGKRIASTEFVDELPPRRKNLKKDDAVSQGTPPPEKTAVEIPKQTQLDDKTNSSSNKPDKLQAEKDKAGKGRKGKRTITNTKPCDTDDKTAVVDSYSELPKVETLPPKSDAEDKDSTSKIKSFAESTNEDLSEPVSGTEPKGLSLLEKTLAKSDDEALSTVSNNSSAPRRTPLDEKFHAGRQGEALSQKQVLAVDQLPPLLANIESKSPQDYNQDVKDKLGRGETSQSGSEQTQRPRMVMYKLVPVEDEEPPGSGASISLLSVSGFFMSGTEGGRILLPENFKTGKVASLETATGVLKSVLLPHSRRMVQSQHPVPPQSQQYPGALSTQSPYPPPTLQGNHHHQQQQQQQQQQIPPISPLRTALSSPLHPQLPPSSSSSSSPGQWNTPHHHQPHQGSSSLSGPQGQWMPTHSGHHMTRVTPSNHPGDMGGGSSTPKHVMVAATPPPPPPTHSPHINNPSTPQSQPQQVQPVPLRQHYQQHQASPALPYRPSPSWNPTPPSMPPSSPQLPSSSSSLSSVWNLASPSSVPQQQIAVPPYQSQHQPNVQAQHQQIPPQASPQHMSMSLQQQQHQQNTSGLQQQQQQQQWMSPQHPTLEDQSWRTALVGESSTAVESWSKEFLPNPPMYTSSENLGQQRRADQQPEVRSQQRQNQMPHHSAGFPETLHQLPHQPPSAAAPNMYAPPVPQHQQQQQQQQQDPADFSDAKADQIIQNFLRSAAGSGGTFGQDLGGFSLGQQDMAYLDSRLRLSPNSLMSAVVAAYEEDVGAGSLEDCDGIAGGAGTRVNQRHSTHGQPGDNTNNSNSLQDTINLVHTVNLVDLEDEVNLGLGGLSASHSSRSSGVVSPRSGALDSPLLALGGRGRTESFHDPLLDGASLQPGADSETAEGDLPAKTQPEQESGTRGEKVDDEEKAKPKDRKHQYTIIHEDGQRKFQCLECDKMFTGATIYRHLRTHDPDHRVTCKVCNRSYTQRSTMIMHMVKIHGYIHTPRMTKKKAQSLNTSRSSEDQKEEEENVSKKEEKKPAKSSKPSGASAKKSSSQAAKTPPGSGKSLSDSKRQRRSSSQSPSNPLAPGLDQEERQIHEATQRQVEEQRRVKAEQKQRKAAGDIFMPIATEPAEISNSTAQGKEVNEETVDQSAESGSDHMTGGTEQAQKGEESSAVAVEKKSNEGNTATPQRIGDTVCLSDKQGTDGAMSEPVEMDKQASTTAATTTPGKAHASGDGTADSKTPKPPSNRKKERQTPSSELDELISAV